MSGIESVSTTSGAPTNTSEPTTTPATIASVVVWPTIVRATASRDRPTDRDTNAVAPTPRAMVTSPISHMMYDAPPIASVAASPSGSPAASIVSTSPTSEFRNDSVMIGQERTNNAGPSVSPASRPDLKRPSGVSPSRGSAGRVEVGTTAISP